MTRTALVTGSAGFVGRHIAAALDDRGYNVQGCDIVNGHDALDLFRLSDQHFDLVVHCAAVVGGRTMIDGAPLELAVADLMLDAALFRWAMRTRPGRVVYFSSSAAYPVAFQAADSGHVRLAETSVPVTKEWFGTPDATYGWVKLTGERLAAEANAEGIRTHVFRPFSGYGADQALDYPFPAIVQRALAHHEYPARTPFEVWGNVASTRDWVHIDDVVGAVLAHIDDDVLGPVNICTGRATSFAELAHMALARAGLNGVPVVGNHDKPMGVFHRVGDPTLMKRVYVPTVTIEDGLDRAIKAAQ